MRVFRHTYTRGSAMDADANFYAQAKAHMSYVRKLTLWQPYHTERARSMTITYKSLIFD